MTNEFRGSIIARGAGLRRPARAVGSVFIAVLVVTACSSSGGSDGAPVTPTTTSDAATPVASDAGTETSTIGDPSAPQTFEANPGGASVTLQGNSVQRADGAAAKLPITVTIGEPVKKGMTKDEVVAAIPSFDGKDKSGAPVVLALVGMIDVKIVDAEGAALQLKDGLPATVKIPRLADGGPTERGLWYYDESAKVWNEYGTATAKDAFYEGTVPHFTRVGVFDACASVCFQGTFEDACNPQASIIPYLRPYKLDATSCGYPGTDYYSGGATDSNGGATFTGRAVRGTYTLAVDYKGKTHTFTINTAEAPPDRCLDLGKLIVPVCADGCCDATGTCQPGTVTSACGKGGAKCVDCGGAACTDQVCTGCLSHADCPSGQACVREASGSAMTLPPGVCADCPSSVPVGETGGSARQCSTPNSTFDTTTATTFYCDGIKCVCSVVGNGPVCTIWRPCSGDGTATEGAMGTCGDGIDNDCDGTADEGCLACTSDASCPSGHECLENRDESAHATGFFCAPCQSRCTPGAACAFGDITNGVCQAYGNGCSRCTQPP